MLETVARYVARHHVALLALFFALGGTAFAAETTLAPKNSVGTRQVINGSLQKVDLSPRAVKSLRGIHGLRGPAGPPGAAGATGARGPIGPTGPTIGAKLADERFSIMWTTGNPAAPRYAAIRGNASIRATNDAGLTVTRVAAGTYCITATDPNEGAVGVLQDQTASPVGGTHGTIDVTMGISEPCPTVPTAQISVRTWALP